MKIKLAVQVSEFVRSLAPQPRRQIRLALKQLSKGQGDIKALEGVLDNYWRLRVSAYRIIFSYRNAQTIECIFAEKRSIVYEVFAEALRERLEGRVV